MPVIQAHAPEATIEDPLGHLDVNLATLQSTDLTTGDNIPVMRLRQPAYFWYHRPQAAATDPDAAPSHVWELFEELEAHRLEEGYAKAR